MTNYVYGYFSSKEAAEAALEDMFASGEVSPCEFSRVYCAFGHMWAIELKH